MLPIRNYNTNWLPDIFDDFFDNNWMPRTNATAPAINVLEDEKNYFVEIAAPGMAKKDFNIHINEDNHLLISMEHENEKKEEDKNKRYLRREFNYSKFQQALILPDDVNKKEIKAKMDDGVLHITLPKLSPEQKQECLQHIQID